MKNQNSKFETIYESYLNGNISWVKAEVKKLSKPRRKELYKHIDSGEFDAAPKTLKFFFELI